MAKIIRAPTRAEGGITDDERVRLKAHADLWISRAMRTTPVNVNEITSAIHDLYAAARLKTPRVVVVPSPLVMAFAYGASAAIWYARKTGAATDAATYAATRDATYAATDDATRAATDDATRDATDDATDAATDDATDAAAWACFEQAGRLGLMCANRWSAVYQGGAYWAGYDCYLTAFRDVIGLQLPQHAAYAAWERAAIAAPFRVLHEEFCLVSDFPEIIRVDDRNLPHCADGPSHRWRDGWELYHWHGTLIPSEWIRDRALTPEIALKWQNAEQRRAACELLGWDAILAALDCKVIDDDGDPEIGVLVEVSLEGQRERFLRVRCGTSRCFALPVPPDMPTALAAQAWTWGLDQHSFIRPEVRT